MAVKDLVQQFESSASSSVRATSPGQWRHVGESQPNGLVSNSEGIQESPPPRFARFIKHRAILERSASEQQARSPLSTTRIVLPGTLTFPNTPTNNSTTISTTSPTTESDTTTIKASSSQSSIPLPHSTISSIPLKQATFADSSTTLTAVDSRETRASFMEHTYPPNNALSESNDSLGPKSPHKRPPLTRRSPPFHKPVPALIMFSRRAYPLSLPKLDHYLASLSPPFLEEEDKLPPGGMFPPFNALAKTGLSMEDLESNSTVAPIWRNRSSILSSSVNILIGLLGSSALASFYSLQGLINTVQIFALILSTIVPVVGVTAVEDKWRQLFLGTIPNILALNFAPVVIESLLFLILVMAIGGVLLYYFYRSTIQCDRYTSVEGLQQTESKGSQWGIVIVTFLLIILYLPLSTMSVHVLVWSQELWAIPNPYTNSTVFPPIVAPLGPSAEFRDPLDFCWTTTMKRNEVNFAPIVVVLSGIVFFFFAIWFPLALRSVIRRSVPKVDKFTELGRPRSRVDMDGEYHRLLNRDRNPFAFLYNGFRRGWGTYIATYLFAKLSTLLIIAVIDPNNCLFRSLSRTTVPIIQQSLLLASTICFFIAQCTFGPFLNPVNNASEWTSRLNYVSTSATALAVTLNIPGKDIINTYVLYCIYIITYGLGFYFSCIDVNWMQKLVKRLTRRIDFSIDIFSPRLDISSSSVHTKRRIWQESITALLLTDPECKIPKEQAMVFAQARDSEFPPYLLDFMGTPSERHVENLKILRDVGSLGYHRAVSLTSGPDFAWYRNLEDVIQKKFTGPDSYWKKPGGGENSDSTSFFGNAWWIPFPPTLVVRYDDGPYAVLRDACDLEAYIVQNSSRDIQRRRYVRMALRALEGRLIRWPYEYVQPVGSHSKFWCCGSRYNAVTSVHYEYAVLSIKRRGHLLWQGLHLGSGFSIQLKYSRDVIASGEIIGLNEDYDLTSSVARFLEINRDLVDEGLFHVEEKISHYRRHHRKECRWKSRVMTYRFLSFVYDRPRNPDGMAQSCLDFERDPRVQNLMLNNEAVFRSAHTRLEAVSVSEVSTWWYIFWDDLWRRNYDTIAGLQKYATDFSPYYKTSIAYTPLPRPALEAFLTQRGMLHKRPRFNDFFHAGFLNKLYLRLNDAVFRDSREAIMFHMGNDKYEMDMEGIDILTQGRSSTLGTGGGTDYNDSWIRTRPTYRWEGLLSDPPHIAGHQLRRHWQAKLGAWMGLTPLWRSGTPSNGLSLDAKVKNGHYVLLDDYRDYTSTQIPDSS